VVVTHQVDVVKKCVVKSVVKEGTGRSVGGRLLGESVKQGMMRKLFEDVVAVDLVQSKFGVKVGRCGFK